MDKGDPEEAKGRRAPASRAALRKSDLEELYAHRLSERVAESVDRSIKRRYLGVSAALALAWAIGTWFGGSALLFHMIGTTVSQTVDKAVEASYERVIQSATEVSEANIEAKARLKAIDNRLAEVDEALEEAERGARAARQRQGMLDRQVLLAQKRATEANDRMNGLRGDVDGLRAGMNIDRARFSDDLKRLGAALTVVANLGEQLGDLQDSALVASAARFPSEAVTAEDGMAQVEKRALSGVGDERPLSEIAEELRKEVNVLSSLIERPTVYLQYSDSLSLERRRRVAETLRKAGFRVPPPAYVPSKALEVRYFYARDEQLAEEVASEATRVLRAQGFSGIMVAAEDYTDLEKVKPPRTTLELWLGVSSPKA